MGIGPTIAVLCLGLLSGCATAAASGVSTASSNAIAIGFQVNSWGNPVYGWTIDASGSATFTERPRGTNLTDPIAARSLTLSAEDFAAVRDIMARAEKLAGKELPCRSRATDLPYGSVTWTRPDGRKDVVRFDYGCAPSARSEMLFDQLDQAGAVILRVFERKN